MAAARRTLAIGLDPALMKKENAATVLLPPTRPYASSRHPLWELGMNGDKIATARAALFTALYRLAAAERAVGQSRRDVRQGRGEADPSADGCRRTLRRPDSDVGPSS